MTSRNADLVIEEIHQTREKISARFGGNIAAIAEDAARRQMESKHLIWRSNKPNEALQSSRSAPKGQGSSGKAGTAA
jgi:hypothetical protein